ncbi:hypothetical protein GCM10009760_30110 [Kitasatospora kazusensis]|uniref:Tox-PL domain-containing protein n=1 Tax=Kitasatospora kazusensis TaxID=407974 RepID=A0ABP5LC93_9ACTN
MAGAHLPGAVPGGGGIHLDGARLAGGPAPSRTPSADHAPGSPDDLSGGQAPGTDTPPAAAPSAGGAVPPMMSGAGGGFTPGPVRSGGRPGAEPHQSPPPAPAGKPAHSPSSVSTPATGGAKLGPVRPRGERAGTGAGDGVHPAPKPSEFSGAGREEAPPAYTPTDEPAPVEKPGHDGASAPEHRTETESGDKSGIAAPHDHDPSTAHDQDTPHTAPDDTPHHENDNTSGPHHDQDTSPHHEPEPEPRPEAEPHRPATDDRPLGTEGGLTEPTPEDHERIKLAVPLNEDGTPQRHPDPTEGKWLAAINGDGPGTSGRNNNCVDATLALLDTFHGHPTAAAARTPDHDANGNPSDLGELGGRDRMENNLGAKFSDLGDGPAAFDRLEDTLRRNGHGSSAAITTSDADGRSHSWGAVNHNGKITYVDGQTGESSDKPLHNGDNGVFAIPLTPDRLPTEPTPHADPNHDPANDRRAPERPGTAERRPGWNVPVDPAYERTPQDYLADGGERYLYRAIRIEPQWKKSYDGLKLVEADGSVGTPEAYQRLTGWDGQTNIGPGDMAATATVAFHVSGENAATQYISFSPNLEKSLYYSANDFKKGMDGESGNTVRPLDKWAPVIKIDVNQLNAGNKLIDLSRDDIRNLTDLAEKPLIAELAKGDREVLVVGEIPGAAVVEVHGVEPRIEGMTAAEKGRFLGDLRSRPHAEDPRRAAWEAAFAEKVPPHFARHFEPVIVDEPPYVPYVPLAEKRKAARQEAEMRNAGAQGGSASKAKKAKKANTSMLSFDFDE